MACLHAKTREALYVSDSWTKCVMWESSRRKICLDRGRLLQGPLIHDFVSHFARVQDEAESLPGCARPILDKRQQSTSKDFEGTPYSSILS